MDDVLNEEPKWYVLHTFSGYENMVQDNLYKTIENNQLQDYIVEVKIPMEDAIEEIRGRFGKQAITYATLLGDIKMPEDGREKVRMPGIMYQ